MNWVDKTGLRGAPKHSLFLTLDGFIVLSTSECVSVSSSSDRMRFFEESAAC